MDKLFIIDEMIEIGDCIDVLCDFFDKVLCICMLCCGIIKGLVCGMIVLIVIGCLINLVIGELQLILLGFDNVLFVVMLIMVWIEMKK